jgi:hypothetical protein
LCIKDLGANALFEVRDNETNSTLSDSRIMEDGDNCSNLQKDRKYDDIANQIEHLNLDCYNFFGSSKKHQSYEGLSITAFMENMITGCQTPFKMSSDLKGVKLAGNQPSSSCGD